VLGVLAIPVIFLTYLLAHLVLIEVGREVVTLRMARPDGSWRETRLWIVDDGDASWIHSGGRDWAARFAGDPVVELRRGGATHRYRAHAVPGPHPEIHRLLREKYGFADWWVRTVFPDDETVVPIRLEPLNDRS
jgi:hypothetical protein